MINASPRLLRRSLLFCLVGIASLQSTVSAPRQQDLPQRQQQEQPQRRHRRGDAKTAKKNTEPTFQDALWEASLERGINFLSQGNPLTFLWRFLFTFPIIHFLTDHILKNALQNGHINLNIPIPSWDDNTVKVFVCEGIFFYVLHLLSSVLHAGVTAPMLVGLESYEKTYRFLSIAFSTGFMGMTLLLPPWSLLILLGGIAVISFFICPEEKDKNVYVTTNVLFAVLAWGTLHGMWYLVVHTNKLDDFLNFCGFQTGQKQAQLQELFLHHGNLGIFKIWEVIKNYLFVGQGAGAVSLQQLLTQNRQSFLFKIFFDYVGMLPSPWREITNYIMQNILFDLAKDFFL